MQGYLKQSTAVNITVTMVSTTDNLSGKTGLTLTIYSSKAGATPAAITPTVTEIDSTNTPGVYKLALTSSHTDTLGELLLHVTSTGAVPVDIVWQISARLTDDLAYPATSGRSMVVDSAGLVDANMVKSGPTGSGSAQTARDLGASVLLSTGTGTGQLDFTSGVVKSNLAQILGTALTETAGLLAGGFKKFFNISTPAATMDHGVLVDTVTTATTATNLTNAPTSGDLTSTMKASVTTAATAATPIAASVSGAVASVTGNVGGNVTGSVGSVATGGISSSSFATGAITAPAIAADAIGASELASDAITEIQSGLATPTNITAGTITTVTNLTNAPTAGDLTATMKTSVTTAATAATPNLNSAYDAAKTAASATNLATAQTAITLISKLLEADVVIDTGSSPWVLKLYESGTYGTTNVLLLSQDMKQADGSAFDDATTQRLGQKVLT